MLVTCPKCGKSSSIPASKASDPGYQVQCLGCDTLYRPPASENVQAPPSTGIPSQTKVASTSFSAGATAGKSPGPVDWKHCIHHSNLRADAVCPVCKKGYCKDCCRSVQTAFICNECGGLCLRPEQYEQKFSVIKQRSRTMLEEIPTILKYPFVDTVSFVILGMIVWVFTALGSFAMMYGGGAVLFSQGLMTAYSFSAMSRVSSGNMKSYIPEINDLFDLIRPLWLGLGALLISSIGIIILLFVFPGATLFDFHAGSNEGLARFSTDLVLTAEAQEDEPVADEDEEDEDEEDDEEEQKDTDEGEEKLAADDFEDEDFDLYPGYVTFLLVLAFGWKLFYGPAALAVAGVSQSFLQTINPLVGLDTIRRMGGVYWITMILYAVLSIAQLIITIPLAAIPFVGSLVKAFVDCYAALVTGCALGLALHKKAPELGLE